MLRCKILRGAVSGWFAIVPVFLGGCNSREAGEATVSGRVTLNEQAVPAGSTVLFRSESTVLVGVVGADGADRLEQNRHLQVPAGSYRVTLHPPIPPQLSEEEEQALMLSGGPLPASPYQDLIPHEYQNASTSPLIYEVRGGPNTFDIKLP